MTFNDAVKVVKKNRGDDPILYGFGYKDLYIFRLLTKNADLGSTLDYHVSVDVNTGEYSIFDAYDELYDNPNEFSEALKHKIDLKEFD